MVCGSAVIQYVPYQLCVCLHHASVYLSLHCRKSQQHVVESLKAPVTMGTDSSAPIGRGISV